jgi:hypothetical protein
MKIRRAKYDTFDGFIKRWYTESSVREDMGTFEGDNGFNYCDIKINEVIFLDKKHGWFRRFLNWIW